MKKIVFFRNSCSFFFIRWMWFPAVAVAVVVVVVIHVILISDGTEYSCPDSASCNDCSNNDSCGSCSSNGGNNTPATQTLTASCSNGSVRCSSFTAGNTISVTVDSLGINSCSQCSCVSNSGTLSCNITFSNAAVNNLY